MRFVFGSDSIGEDKGLGVMYRVYAQRYAPLIDEWGHPYGDGGFALHVLTFNIQKATPCGKWIERYYEDGLRFVKDDTRKRFAQDTVEAAYQDFVARKRSQLRILATQQRRAHQEMVEAEQQLSKLLSDKAKLAA